MPLTGGDSVDRIIKISNWPQAVVAIVGLLSLAAIVVALILAGWSAEAIVGFAVLTAGLFTGQAVAARKASTIEAKTDHQTGQLETIVRQTNGLTEEDRARIAEEAADLAAVKIVAAYNNGEMGGPRNGS